MGNLSENLHQTWSLFQKEIQGFDFPLLHSRVIIVSTQIKTLWASPSQIPHYSKICLRWLETMKNILSNGGENCDLP